MVVEDLNVCLLNKFNYPINLLLGQEYNIDTAEVNTQLQNMTVKNAVCNTIRPSLHH